MLAQARWMKAEIIPVAEEAPRPTALPEEDLQWTNMRIMVKKPKILIK